MVGWLSGFRVQTGSVAYCCNATFDRRLGEAATPSGGKCGPCPDFASNTLAFALQLREIKGVNDVRQREICTTEPPVPVPSTSVFRWLLKS